MKEPAGVGAALPAPPQAPWGSPGHGQDPCRKQGPASRRRSLASGSHGRGVQRPGPPCRLGLT